MTAELWHKKALVKIARVQEKIARGKLPLAVLLKK